MKMVVNFIIFGVVFSVLQATEFTEEQYRLFLPFIRRWVPPSCPMNELYRTCTGNCSDCTQRGRCIVTKCIEGCDCAPHFFRVTPNGRCEPVANCPKPECKENEIFRECGPVSESCRYLESHTVNCDHKCYCKEGYSRNSEGVCIPKEECPKRTRCSRSEVWAESGPVSEFCFPKIEEDVINKTQNIPGCYCIEGYKRNLLGICVNETVCPLIKCFGNEVYYDCIPKCKTTCRNKDDLDCVEDDNCYPGCFCPPGYVMNDFRSCVEIDKCSLEIDQVRFSDTKFEDDVDTTLPPTPAPTDATTLEIDSTFVNDSAEYDYEENINSRENVTVITKNETISSATTERPNDSTAKEKFSTSATTMSATSDFTPKDKTFKWDKITRIKETKHENTAKEKDSFKYGFVEDEDWLINDHI